MTNVCETEAAARHMAKVYSLPSAHHAAQPTIVVYSPNGNPPVYEVQEARGGTRVVAEWETVIALYRDGVSVPFTRADYE